MSLSWTDREWIAQQFAAVMAALSNQTKEIKIIMTTQQQFDVLLTTLGTTIGSEDSTLTTLLGLVQQIIAKATAAGVDLTAEATQVGTINTDIQNQTKSISDAAAAINAALNPPAAS